MIGQTLGRYRIVRHLGTGGMGTVWWADDTLLRRPVALKLLPEHLAGSPTARQRFVREARAASQLDHPAIARVYDAGDVGGQAYIAYQLIEGETLSHAVVDSPLPISQGQEMACEVADALAHAHARGVLHRDLTAGNVMLRHRGGSVIVDFGLARDAREATLTSTGTTMGTAAYIAPEIWQGREATVASDLWSLGVVLYRALVGRLPFEGGQAEAVMYRVLGEEPAKPRMIRRELPVELERIILRLLEKDSRDRYTNASEVVAELRKIRVDERLVEVAAPTQAFSPLADLRRRWHRLARRRFGPAQLALVMFAAAAIGVVFAWRARPGSQRDPVLAVLPLRNASTDVRESGYAGEAFGGELVEKLREIGGVRLLPWETSVRVVGLKEDLRRVARRLGADFLVVGSYQIDGSRLRVHVELVDGMRGWEKWAETFEGASADLVQLQTKVAGALASEIRPSLSKSARLKLLTLVPKNAEAYEVYLRGASAMHSDDESTHTLAEPLFRRAIELDSTLAQAWVALGAVENERYFSGNAGLRELVHARDCFRHALELKPGLPAAQRGLLRFYEEAGPTEAGLALFDSMGTKIPDQLERELTRAWAFTLGGLPEEGIISFDRVLRLDPENQGAIWYRGVALFWAGRDAECERASKEYMRKYGEDAVAYFFGGLSAAELGLHDEAMLFLARAYELYGGGGAMVAAVYAASQRRLGRLDSVSSIASRAIPRARRELDAHPDNLRMRFDLVSLEAVAGHLPRASADWAEAQRLRAAGRSATGGQEVFPPFAFAQAGDLSRAIASLPPGNGIDAGIWGPAFLKSFGDVFSGGASAEFRASPEFSVTRKRLDAERARLTKRYVHDSRSATSALPSLIIPALLVEGPHP